MRMRKMKGPPFPLNTEALKYRKAGGVYHTVYYR